VPENEREDAHARFQQAQDAYDVLKDPQTRATYDELGVDGVKKGAHSHSADDAFEDMLSHMFGGGFGGGFAGGMPGMAGMGQGRRSADAVTQIEVTLEELYKGKQVKMMSKRKIICSTCQGYLFCVVC
jgi:DnaJ family protein A protein 2